MNITTLHMNTENVQALKAAFRMQFLDVSSAGKIIKGW